MSEDWTDGEISRAYANPNSRARGWLVAGSGAALVHLLAFAAASIFALSPPQTSGMRSVAVTLVGSIPGPAGRSGGNASPSLAQLQQALGETESIAQQSPRGSVDGRRTDLLAASDREGAQDGSSTDQGQIDPNAYASLNPAMARIATSRGLRDRALRCWDRPATPRTVHVRVTLDSRGTVVGAPRVIGSALDAFDPPQAAANARAVSAVEHCAPYAVPPTDAPTAYDLEFH